MPEKNDKTYQDKEERLSKICQLIDEIDYCFLATDASDASLIKAIYKPEEFNDKQKRDYILVHKEESKALKSNLLLNDSQASVYL